MSSHAADYDAGRNDEHLHGSDMERAADYDAGVEPLQECERCRVMCAPGMACVNSQPGHPDAERPCRPEVPTPDAEKDAPQPEYGCCRVCPITVEHWHYGESRPLGSTPRVTPGGSNA